MSIVYNPWLLITCLISSMDFEVFPKKTTPWTLSRPLHIDHEQAIFGHPWIYQNLVST